MQTRLNTHRVTCLCLLRNGIKCTVTIPGSDFVHGTKVCVLTPNNY